MREKCSRSRLDAQLAETYRRFGRSGRWRRGLQAGQHGLWLSYTREIELGLRGQVHHIALRWRRSPYPPLPRLGTGCRRVGGPEPQVRTSSHHQLRGGTASPRSPVVVAQPALTDAPWQRARRTLVSPLRPDGQRVLRRLPVRAQQRGVLLQRSSTRARAAASGRLMPLQRLDKTLRHCSSAQNHRIQLPATLSV